MWFEKQKKNKKNNKTKQYKQNNKTKQNNTNKCTNKQGKRSNRSLERLAPCKMLVRDGWLLSSALIRFLIEHSASSVGDGDFKLFQYQCYTSHIGSLLQYQCNRGNRAIWQFDEAYRRPIGTFFVFTILRPKMQNGWSKIFEDNTAKFKLMQEEASLEKCSRRRFDGNISASAAHF